MLWTAKPKVPMGWVWKFLIFDYLFFKWFIEDYPARPEIQ